MGFLPRLLILILVLLAGWYAYRWYKRVLARNRAEEHKTARGPERAGAIEMEKCRICGDFVPGGARACGRADCPFPAA